MGKVIMSGIVPLLTVPGLEPIAIFNVPSQSGTLTYTGSVQSPTWNNYDDTQLTIGGTTSATEAGTYSATFTPKDGYAWSDGTTTTKTVTWTIETAEIIINFTGDGDRDSGYAIVDGTTYFTDTTSSSDIVVYSGDVITFGVYGYRTSYPGSVTIDGVKVLTTTGTGIATYEWTVPGGISAITVDFSIGTRNNGIITVTTA